MVKSRSAVEPRTLDLRFARRRRSSARPLSSGQSDPPADPGDCVPARRGMVRGHADDRAGLQALLRAGRVRDRVARVSPDPGDHVSRQRRGRAHRGALAEGERGHARARRRSHLPVGHIGRRAPGGGCRAGAAGHVRRAPTTSISRARCAACSTATGRRASTAWMPRPSRSARRCSRRS